MKPLTLALVLAAAIAFAAPAPAATDAALVAAVQGQIAAPAVLRGEFEQRKTLKGFKNPLVSRGDFLVVAGKGVVWRTRTPFPSSMVVTAERLQSRLADGSLASSIDAQQAPALRTANTILLAAMAGDLSALTGYFELTGTAAAGRPWHLLLLPSDPALARWMARIEIDGERFVQDLRLVEAAGDTTDIHFSSQAGASSASAEELLRFQ